MSADAGPRPAVPLLADDVEVGEGVTFGAYVVVHAGTAIGRGCAVSDHAVLGKRPALAAHSSARGELGRLMIGGEVTVGTGAIVFAGARIGDGAILGDQSFVRERSAIGEATVIGRGTVVDNDVAIGARVRVQTDVYLTAYSVVEDDVFIGPRADTTNDQTMARHAPDELLRGALLRRACRVGAASVLLPGVEIGEEAFVAAGSVVTRDVPARSLVMGTPARVVREISDAELLENWR